MDRVGYFLMNFFIFVIVLFIVLSCVGFSYTKIVEEADEEELLSLKVLTREEIRGRLFPRNQSYLY